MSYFPSAAAIILAIGEQTSVSINTPTTVATIPANGRQYITGIICTGEVNARWDIFVNSVRRATKRTTDRNVEFEFNTPFELAGSSVLDIKVTHHGPEANADFQATVLGFLG
jgi:hypothetical protein